MLELNSFPNKINAVVIGASGGIGQAFIKHLVECEKIANVYAFARGDILLNDPKITKGYIDFNDEESIKGAAGNIDKPCHIIITATGILHDKNLAPEKTLRHLDAETMNKVMQVNFMGPALVGKYFMPLLPRDEKSVFAVLSARVGSISDNQLGGWYSYRASKAALNMFIKTASIEVARKHNQAVVIGLHPGTVETNLSEPFQGNVSKEKLFTPEHSTAQMLRVINNVTPDQTGSLMVYDEEIIAP